MNTIVVGVDGSKGSQQALEWAMAEARLHSATLRAVHVVQPDLLPAYVIGRAGGYAGPTREQQREAGDRLLDEALRSAAEGVAVERHVVLEESPAKALIDAAQDADLLVVGSRGLGGFQGLVLGSVGLQCVTHAPCPVVVVPPAER
jgi:nucleotide-binding universal stress UspA family protein